MFYVINKSKIYSYLIALSTVVILFMAATAINDAASPNGNIVTTGTNAVTENEIYSNTVENNISNIIDNNTINIIANNIVGD